MAEYYLDVDFVDYETDTSVSVIWTNASSTVTADADLTANIAVGDYIRSNDPTYGGTWYKVTAISYDTATLQTSITINTSFKEDTHTAGLQRNRGDGSKLNPFCHLAQFTTDTVRSPGDILYCQNGQILKCAFYIEEDEQGTQDNQIKVVSNDWKLIGNTEKFVLDGLGLQNYLVNMYFDRYWQWENIHFKNNNYTYGMISVAYKSIVKFINCEFSEVMYTGIYATALNISDACAELHNCEFYECKYAYIRTSGAFAKLYNCCDNTSTTYIPIYSIRFYGFSKLYLINTNFNYNILINTSKTPEIYAINSNVPSVDFQYDYTPFAMFYDDTNNRLISKNAVVEKDSSVLFSSGNIAIKYTDSGDFGKFISVPVSEWQVELPSGTYTAQVLVKTSGLLTLPTDANLYIEVEYIDDELSNHVNWTRSTDIVTANDTETTLSVTFTQAKYGKVRLRVYCGFDTVNNGGGAIYIENGFTII